MYPYRKVGRLFNIIGLYTNSSSRQTLNRASSFSYISSSAAADAVFIFSPVKYKREEKQVAPYGWAVI